MVWKSASILHFSLDLASPQRQNGDAGYPVSFLPPVCLTVLPQSLEVVDSRVSGTMSSTAPPKPSSSSGRLKPRKTMLPSLKM